MNSLLPILNETTALLRIVNAMEMYCVHENAYFAHPVSVSVGELMICKSLQSYKLCLRCK